MTAAPRPRRLVRITGLIASCGLALGVTAYVWAFPQVSFPAPRGGAVGTTVVQWADPARDDRPVVGQVWYPAKAGDGSRSWYLGRDEGEARTVAEALGSTYGVPAFLLAKAAKARTPARWNAAPAVGADRWPVVLFSPGLGGYRAQSTAWAMEVAGAGYVVVALDHVGDSAVVVLDDGSAVPTVVRSTGDDDEDDRNADGWAAARAEDLRFALSRLEAGDGLGVLADRLDLEHVAATGHSIGGAAALQATIEDRRFDAAIDIDGFPRNVADGASYPQPVLVLIAGRGSGNAANDVEYRREVQRVLAGSSAGGDIVVVDGASHLSFTDAPRFLPPVPSIVGSLGRGGASGRTARETVNFLDGVFQRG